MKFNNLPFALVFFCAFFTPLVIAQPDTGNRVGSSSGIFQALKVGQKVSLKENFGQYEISLLNNGELGSHIIVEINASHLVLIDIGQITRSWVPASAVKVVAWTKVPAVLPNKP